MNTLADVTWSTPSTLTFTHAVIYRNQNMPSKLLRKKGKRGKKLRRRWRATQMVGYITFPAGSPASADRPNSSGRRESSATR